MTDVAEFTDVLVHEQNFLLILVEKKIQGRDVLNGR